MASQILRRPQSSEYKPYYEGYVSAVPGTDVVAVLRDELDSTLALLESVPEAKVDYRYAPGKWTLRQVFGHVVDMEWVFAVRALHFARGVPGPMPGVDQDDVMKVANFERQTWASLLEQFRHLRAMGCEVGQGYLFGPARPPEVYGIDPRQMFAPRRRSEAHDGRAPGRARDRVSN